MTIRTSTSFVPHSAEPAPRDSLRSAHGAGLRLVRTCLSLVVPTALAELAMYAPDEWSSTARAAAMPLAALTGATIIAVAVRSAAARRYGLTSGTVLTSSGARTMWSAAFAILLASVTGWASFAVLGVLGFGLVQLTLIYTAIVASGIRPWRDAHVERALVPEVASDDEPVREQVTIRDLWIPPGTRLFAAGWPARRSAMSRYALGSEASRADVRLESVLGVVPRGEYVAPPLSMWLGDVLGLTRTSTVYRGGSFTLTVLPRVAPIDGARVLLGAGGDAATTVPTERRPTEGSFRIREYAPGDDARRIHWVRSLQLDQLIVRLPDEIPPADPIVRLVLDNHLWSAEMLSCQGGDQLLDAMLYVWLGVGKALAGSGVRVSMVTVARRGEQRLAVIDKAMLSHAPREAQKLAATVGWQSTLGLEHMLRDDQQVRQIVVSAQPRPTTIGGDVKWIYVPIASWSTAEPMFVASDALLPFPIGAADNRVARRKRERRRIENMQRDRRQLEQSLVQQLASGMYVAQPANGRVALAVIP